MAEQMGRETLINFYADLGLFERPPLELVETGQPMLPARWGRAEVMTASYGHGLQCDACGGGWRRPMLRLPMTASTPRPRCALSGRAISCRRCR